MMRPRFAHAHLIESFIGVAAILMVSGLVLFSTGQATAPAGDQRAESASVGASSVTAVQPTVTITVPTPEIGEAFSLPSAPYASLTLARTDLEATTSKELALQAVQGWMNAPLNAQVSATFGLATFGRPGENDGPWIGDRNVPLPTGQILDHIENRPMWIIDVGGVEGFYAGEPGLSVPNYNHVVYAVDDQTGAVLFAWSYPGQ